MKQLETKKITGRIVVKTGLHIGAGNEKVEIGGMDNPIIRNPLTQEPYIPGSSIKGKLRSLMEWKLEKLNTSASYKEFNGCKCGMPDCQICRVFGSANNGKNADDESAKRGPTRVIVRDAVLTKDWKDAFADRKPIVEEKNENALNRITAHATPRPIERVVPGVEFDFEIDYRVIDTGDGGETDKKYFNEVVLESLKLLKNDFLGGGGSRGNGQIEFIDLKDESGNEIKL